MLRNLIVLPDGTEIFSGTPGENSIKSLTVTESVNIGTELTIGSVCAAMLEATLITRNGNLHMAAGDMLTLYKVDDMGNRTQAGVFHAEKPARPSAHTYKLTAYDAASKLDKDLTAWLAGLDGWPYQLIDFAAMVCAECGLELSNEEIPNGDYAVRQFSAQVTGRQLMRWVGEACGRFCRATAEGKMEFAWYASSGAAISPSGDLFYYGGSLSYEDYEVAPVEKVQIRLTDSDIGVIWPNEEGTKNTYIITGNYLLTTDTSDGLLGVAQTLYEILKEVKYTPCKVAVPAYLGIRAGDIISVSDRNGFSFETYIMTRTGKGQRDTLESTGSPRRDSSTAVNNQTIEKLYGRTLEIQKSVEGLSVKATQIEQDADGKYSELSSRVEQNASAVEMAFSEIREQVDANTAGREEVQVHIRFGADGITMGRTDSAMTQQLSHDRNVFRSSGEEVSGTDAYKHWAKRIEGTESGQMANLEFKRRSNGNAVIRYKRR